MKRLILCILAILATVQQVSPLSTGGGVALGVGLGALTGAAIASSNRRHRDDYEYRAERRDAAHDRRELRQEISDEGHEIRKLKNKIRDLQRDLNKARRNGESQNEIKKRNEEINDHKKEIEDRKDHISDLRSDINRIF